MPEMQSTAPVAAGIPPASMEAAGFAFQDCDFALGCECADPALQIERWGQDALEPDTN